MSAAVRAAVELLGALWLAGAMAEAKETQPVFSGQEVRATRSRTCEWRFPRHSGLRVSDKRRWFFLVGISPKSKLVIGLRNGTRSVAT